MIVAALVRHFAILAALTLTACALPGASGTGSFMAQFHPTQDFCASRGMTLDATTKQCVTPQAAEATGSLPSANAKTQSPAPPSQSPLAQPPAPAASSQHPPQSVAVQVQPPPPAAAAPPAPSPLQEHQRATASVPIEPDAAIYPKLQQDADLMTELAHFVRASGYRCDSISALQPGSDAHGFKLACNRSAYKYAIEGKDGRWSVTVE